MEDIFTLPGIYLLRAVADGAPSVAALLGISEPGSSIALVVVLATVAWLLLVVGCWLLFKLVRDSLRYSEAMVRTIGYRTTEAIGSIRTWLICTRKKLRLRRKRAADDEQSEIHFDDFDFTVLRAAAAGGPGTATSAPELAGRYGLRPSQFQQSLGKLRQNKMLTEVIGSTDGFENYRLTDYGAAYIRMWEQRQAG